MNQVLFWLILLSGSQIMRFLISYYNNIYNPSFPMGLPLITSSSTPLFLDNDSQILNIPYKFLVFYLINYLPW
jgi:hypothetical protein